MEANGVFYKEKYDFEKDDTIFNKHHTYTLLSDKDRSRYVYYNKFSKDNEAIVLGSRLEFTAKANDAYRSSTEYAGQVGDIYTSFVQKHLDGMQAELAT